MSAQTVERNLGDIIEPKLALEDLVLPANVRMSLEDSLLVYRSSDILFKQWNLDRLTKGKRRFVVCLHGDPGTGKTEAAEALAYELGFPLLRVNYAEIEGSLVGETSKNLVQVFEAARQMRALLHFDESDSALSRRVSKASSGSDNAVNSARSTMLIELEKHPHPVVFSTNLVKAFDSAFERRIDHFIEFALPGVGEREKLLSRFLELPTGLPKQPSLDVNRLADESYGLSPADLKKAIHISSIRLLRPGRQVRALGFEDMRIAFDEIRSGKLATGQTIVTDSVATSPGDSETPTEGGVPSP